MYKFVYDSELWVPIRGHHARVLVTLPWTRPLVMLHQMGKVDI